ncbi:MAG: EscF/YscF/HrpA family type III secretion system needle major subunit [Puniceicoccales bacterium]|jgi:hypothetical protein|nr:EscF/YscF/HrpA family type III secretion system needle major subunit [Puniceicoccales bacterium]
MAEGIDFGSELFETTGSNGSCYTLDNLYRLLGQVVSAQESDLNNEIQELATQGASVDQGSLLKVQGMVQSWGVVSGLATGTLRAAGDALSKTTQNIR